MAVSVITGDCLDVLLGMPSQSVHTCVTSPPYWGLRDYNVAGQLGLESTPDAFVAAMVGVFSEVRRVLRDDGTCWVNLGDSYATDAPGAAYGWTNGKTSDRDAATMGSYAHRRTSLPPKNLVGIPWRVAFALQADGWYLRSDIIWHKPNPMPESVTDRPTKAHEYIFLLSKSQTYYYDAEAIAEPVSASMLAQLEQGYNGTATKDYAGAGVQDPSAVKSRILSKHKNTMDKGQTVHSFHARREMGLPDAEHTTRNKRTVWTVTTKPYSGAHFATFPPDLIEPCILAGCPVGGTVLDPFGGAGTTGLVADRLQRNAVLIELNPEYAQLARDRITRDSPLFAEVTA